MFSALSNFVFGASSLFGSHSQLDNVKTSTWKDKKLCFDLRPNELELDRGEQLIGCFFPIEDFKGNSEQLGLLKVTNLRVIWICCKKIRVNLSIGWRTVGLVNEQNHEDHLRGATSSLCLLSKYESTKYEFIFKRRTGMDNQLDCWINSGGGSQESWNSLALLRQFHKEKPALISHLSQVYLDDPFDVLFKTWLAYRQTHLFRHCRSNLTSLVTVGLETTSQINSDLILSDIQLLPSEEIQEVLPRVAQNDGRTIRYIGTLILTNIRILWLDDTNLMRNYSIPYTRIDSIHLKSPVDSVRVNTHDYLTYSRRIVFKQVAGGDNTKSLGEQLENMFRLYKSKPRYGPESCEDCINFMSHLRPTEQSFDLVDKSMLKALENFGPEPKVSGRDTDQIAVTEVSSERTVTNDDEIERVERDLDGYTTTVLSYLSDKQLIMEQELIYSKDLGLAMERPANGASIDSIWRIYA